MTAISCISYFSAIIFREEHKYMAQDNKNTTGAPSNDTTSALFVSARKKQLEQQEAERRVKEKEEQRLAAEAEVKRLEREVEERRRKAEMDAKQADEEARRIAEQSRAKIAGAAANPDAVLGSQPAKTQVVTLPNIKPSGIAAPSAVPSAAPFGGGVAVAIKSLNMKQIAIIGVAVIIVVILIAALGGRGGGDDLDGRGDYIGSDVADGPGIGSDVADGPGISSNVADGPGAIIKLEDMGGAPAGMKRFSDNDMGLAFNYSARWTGVLMRAGGSNLAYDCVMVTDAEAPNAYVIIANYTEQYIRYINGGGTDGNALLESFISDIGMLLGYKVSELSGLTYLDVIDNPDGSIQFTAIWDLDGSSAFAAVAVWEDRDVAGATFVIMSDEEENFIEAVLMSIEVW
jgi:hypothetical protein